MREGQRKTTSCQIILLSRGSFMKGGIQQLRGQNIAITEPPLPGQFYTLSLDKNKHFFTPSPLILST